MKKILIANRGEIALRVMHTAKRMGIKTVAVYSDVDRLSPHTLYADEAVNIGPAPSSESYLRMETIINAALETGADAIHPGYGFLSENAEFSKIVAEKGLIFIGPKPSSIKIMGDKLAAKAAVKGYNIPLVPGIDEAVRDVEEAIKVADEVGYPILIKAAAGGGGKGMRMVNEKGQVAEQMERAISEAISAFGNGEVFIERYVTKPRHIEVQVLADQHGNCIHLLERECSIQRRHQKVVEEAPSSVLTVKLRQQMGEAAVKVAESCDYEGAGTVEFLLDADHNFFFLEMNTRLQVEHPVTELITGVDLVEQQIRVARGEQLSIKQSDIAINGHSFEVRVYAEDPLNDFLPSIGKLDTYQPPHGDGIRVDDGYREGMNIPIYYDPLISKLITYGRSREEAIAIMRTAIKNYKIKGIETTLPFASFVFEHDAFVTGDFDTHFVKKYFDKEVLKKTNEEEEKLAAVIGLTIQLEERKKLKAPTHHTDNWQMNRR